jgi:hypothetical protein
MKRRFALLVFALVAFAPAVAWAGHMACNCWEGDMICTIETDDHEVVAYIYTPGSSAC